MTTEHYYWVYILGSKIGGTLYVGVTNDLVRRVYEHRNNVV
ncbi:MAG TPA: GIY-YIG nuclease family protein, partial [Xanthobacteraceae bacterium]|nr:GIY-YIG nuclease family protein [Xanthobacteraceae bacterium]